MRHRDRNAKLRWRLSPRHCVWSKTSAVV